MTTEADELQEILDEFERRLNLADVENRPLTAQEVLELRMLHGLLWE